MSEETKQDTSNLSDSELTPKQLAQRVRNRAKKAKKKLANSGNANSAPAPVSTSKEDVEKRQYAPAKLSDEEYTKELIDKKSERVSRNPRAAVVSIAETNESRALAFKINEINMITDYTRSNMGGSKISFDDGAKLINMFKDDITANIEKFIALANSLGIGSRYSLREYEENQNKIKAREKSDEARREKSKESEIPLETKEREAMEKTLEKTKADLAKAQDTLIKAQKDAATAEDNLKQNFQDTLFAQKTRKDIERAEKDRVRQAAEIEKKSKASVPLLKQDAATDNEIESDAKAS